MADTDTDTPGWQELADYVGAADADQAIVESSYDVARELVTGYVGRSEVPPTIVARAVLEVGSELYHRKNAPNGVAQFNTFDAAPIRVARDPMVAARPLLAPFLLPGIA